MEVADVCPDTDLGVFVGDGDAGASSTDATDSDSDDDGRLEGDEGGNGNGNSVCDDDPPDAAADEADPNLADGDGEACDDNLDHGLIYRESNGSYSLGVRRHRVMPWRQTPGCSGPDISLRSPVRPASL